MYVCIHVLLLQLNYFSNNNQNLDFKNRIGSNLPLFVLKIYYSINKNFHLVDLAF